MHRRITTTGPLALFLLSAAAFGAPSGTFDAGPLAARFEDAHGHTRLKILGPFFESAYSTQGWRLAAFRPFYSEAENPAEDKALRDYLWPLATWRRTGNEEISRYAIFFRLAHGEDRPHRRYRFWLLPFYFEGRDAQGAFYRAVFPFGGTIREFLGRDEITFVLFPLRSTSRLNDLETSNWLWPIISRTEGEGILRYRVFPFYGRSVREGAYDKRFILWPMWTEARYDYPGSKGRGFLLVPICGHMKLEDQESWWVIPPFFRYARGKNLTLLYAPWPFIQYQSGETGRLYVWPIYGRKTVGNFERTFVLWPLFWHEKTERDAATRRSTMLIPFYFHAVTAVSNEPPNRRYLKVWPLFSYRRNGDEAAFRTLELWPIADSGAVERNWAPFWTLYFTARKGEATDREALWGLFRAHARPDDRLHWSLFPLFEWRREPGVLEWSVLEGLLGRERKGSRARWRVLFFIRFGPTGSEEVDAP